MFWFFCFYKTLAGFVMERLFLQDYRCKCGKLLFKGFLVNGNVEVKCRRCGIIMNINGLVGDFSEIDRYVLLLSRRGEIINASDSAATILRYSVGELVNKNIRDIDAAMPADFYDRLWSSASNTDNFFRFISLYQVKDGTTIPVAVRFKSFMSNNRELAINIVDRTRYNSGDDDFFCEVDTRGNLLYIDPEAEKLIGYDPREVTGKSLSSFFAPEGLKDDPEWFKSMTLNNRHCRISNAKMTCKDGKIKPFESYLMPRFNDIGDCTGYQILSWLNKSMARTS